ncbi:MULTISPECIES: NAD(P)-dependent malic enzyme [Fictibacillus]|uniref:Malate dehydrogenase n=1 Tax=Fictibacillus enclensis TaxID=1017270 RepID=A0A0V8JET0_9BACL|nr:MULTISPECIES: malic enzyme-like NAD(P)-binding protein [Fictibacillus]KSU85405.1 malate dehydrogenase [Fictibacillus enclensis]MDM5199307.1 malic enzyme-like NAD(P)-binding protein [Fictibacillus enclensis]RXY98930.1 NAD-dependent malic enzyme [Fictibacillus sp. S7]SCB96162.1 malate dehydrogenase (oxaloacetate-decarboxylating) [Fictibacillus enclensis]
MQNLKEKSLELHKQSKGKLSVAVKVTIENADDLSLAYSPGVAEPCKAIYQDPQKIYDYTIKGNVVAVVSDGSAVLGLGNIGAGASMPVMEGKAALFKAFAGIDAFPICLNTQDAEQIIQIVKSIEPTFGGINLEDISAPNCFIIEERLKKEMDIPVFHDDQHGTAIVTAAGLINALKVVNKRIEDTKIVVNGAGAAGIAVTKLLINMGVNDLILCDSKGAIFEGRAYGMNAMKDWISVLTNKENAEGSLQDVIKEADVFIGVSVAEAVTPEMVESMGKDPIIFAMANPIPEIMPVLAKAAGAAVVGTGRSDLPNQVNNVLAFPGIFKGALQVFASEINEEMKIAAVYAIANLITTEELTYDYVIPHAFDKRVVEAVAKAVADAAISTGVARNISMKQPTNY